VLATGADAFIGHLTILRTDGAIAYVEGRQNSGAREWRLNVLEPDGTARSLFSDSGQILWPCWLPSGRALLVIRPRTPREGEIWRIDRFSGASTRTGVSMRALRNIDVSPDGRELTFTAGSPSREVWVLSNFVPVQATPGEAARAPRNRRLR
jgi:hypothetical protein